MQFRMLWVCIWFLSTLPVPDVWGQLDESYDRLGRALDAVADHWRDLPEPIVAPSGMPPREILSTASEADLQQALDLITGLIMLEPEERPALLETWLASHQPTEVDLWLPGPLAEQKRMGSPTEAATIVEAWLQWLERAGRRDVLPSAASDALDLLGERVDAEALLPLAREWAALPRTNGDETSRAHLLKSYAELLFRCGEYSLAREAYHDAAALFHAVGDLLGQGNVLRHEGVISARLGRHEEALAVYRRARKLFQTVGDERGLANVWDGEAKVLFQLGKYDSALTAYHKARASYETLGDLSGKAETIRGEANILFFRGDNEGALETLRHARELFQTSDDLLGQGNTWDDEGDVLSFLGANDEALTAYRVARRLFERANDALGQGNTWRGEGEIFVIKGENKAALKAFHRARELFKASGDELGQANVLLNEAHILARRGNSSVALDAYRSARWLFERVNDKVGQGNSSRGEASVLFLSGQAASALKAFRRARDLFEDAGDQLGQANALTGEADILHLEGESEKALQAYRGARDLYRKLGARLGQGNTLLGEANIFFDRGQHLSAQEVYQQALVFFEAAGSPLSQANTYLSEGSILVRLGKIEQALEKYRQAQRRFEPADDLLGLGNALAGEAEALAALGEDPVAFANYRRAQALLQAAGDQIGQARAWHGQGDLYLRSDRLTDALNCYHRASELQEAVHYPLGQGNSLLGEANALLELGQHQEALDKYLEARQLYASIDHQLGRANTVMGEARVLYERQSWPVAAEGARTAGAYFKSASLTSNRLNALVLEARALERLDDDDAAIAVATEAIELQRDWRETRITDPHRVRIDEPIAVAYELLISLRLCREELDEALRLAEAARSRVLLDWMLDNRGPDSPATDLTAESRFLRLALAQVEQELALASTPVERERLQAQRWDLDRRLMWNHYEQIAGRQPRMLTAAEPLDSPAMRALSEEVGPILLYYTASRELAGFLILPGRETPIVRRIALPREELRERIESLVTGLANPLRARAAQAEARALWDALIGSFANDLPEEGPMTVIPHGPLHELPFDALEDAAGKPLFERWQVAVAPSVSVLVMTREHPAEPRRGEQVLFALSSGKGLSLPTYETEDIARFFNEVRPIRAVFDNYRRVVPEARHLLISTRGLHQQGSRTNTYLEIDGDKDHDSRLSPFEIATIPIKAELVTLAACETAAGQAFLSDERLDLTRAFLIAGAASVLATRWRAPEDERTTRFLVDFYRAYRRGGPEGQGMRKDAALAEARRRSRQRGDPPLIWAAWVLVGDARGDSSLAT